MTGFRHDTDATAARPARAPRSAMASLRRLLAVATLATAFGSAAMAGHLHGCDSAPLRVTTLADEDDPDGCGGAACSLREAVAHANACAGPVTIRLPPGRHALERTGFAHPHEPARRRRSRGDSAIMVRGRIRIEAPAAGTVIARAPDAPAFRLFEVAPDAWLALVGVTLKGGRVHREGGGAVRVANGGLLLVERAEISGNAARRGGALEIAGGARIADSRFADNRAVRGGGIFVAPAGRVWVDRSRLEENTTADPAGIGGGMEVRGEARIRDTVFSRNAAHDGAAVAVSRPGRVVMSGGRVDSNIASENSGAVEMPRTSKINGTDFVANTPTDHVDVQFGRGTAR